ncbi:MAG: hypothetical protein NT046_01075 [Arenimonas sp.]|nr:hypothetical protein [Arenimonas sp.]
MRLTPLATVLLITLCLAACGGDDKPAPPAATEAPVEAVAEEVPAELPPMPTGDFRITSVTLGKAVDEEGQVRQSQDTFAPTDKIFAAVVSVGSSDGLTLAARWTAADGTVVASAGQSLNPSTPTVTTFSIAQPEPWPAGGYKLEVSVNDRVVESRSFLVQ